MLIPLQWKGQFAGIAASAADAYMSAGLYQGMQTKRNSAKRQQTDTTLLRRGETTHHVNVRFWHTLSNCMSFI